MRPRHLPLCNGILESRTLSTEIGSHPLSLKVADGRLEHEKVVVAEHH